MEVTKKDVEKLIEMEKKNTFLNHLWNVFSRDRLSKGEIKKFEIKVWNQNMWNMTFYPIFTFEFNSNNHLTNITDKMNPVGKVIIGIATIWFLFLIFPKKPTEFNPIDNWQWVTLIMIFVFLVVFVSRKIYNMERINQLEEIYEILDIEINEKVLEKEWSVKNILIRLFTYPFSIFVITICVWSLFADGLKSIFMTIFGIGICGMYLYYDIKMIMNNKKEKQ